MKIYTRKYINIKDGIIKYSMVLIMFLFAMYCTFESFIEFTSIGKIIFIPVMLFGSYCISTAIYLVFHCKNHKNNIRNICLSWGYTPKLLIEIEKKVRANAYDRKQILITYAELVDDAKCLYKYEQDESVRLHKIRLYVLSAIAYLFDKKLIAEKKLIDYTKEHDVEYYVMNNLHLLEEYNSKPDYMDYY